MRKYLAGLAVVALLAIPAGAGAHTSYNIWGSQYPSPILAIGHEHTDVIQTGAAGDDIRGNGDYDSIEGRGGADRITGGTGNDVIHGNSGGDDVNGGDGADDIYGGNENDVLKGDDGNDFIDCGDGADDSAFGGPGDDTFANCDGNAVE